MVNIPFFPWILWLGNACCIKWPHFDSLKILMWQCSYWTVSFARVLMPLASFGPLSSATIWVRLICLSRWQLRTHLWASFPIYRIVGILFMISDVNAHFGRSIRAWMTVKLQSIELARWETWFGFTDAVFFFVHVSCVHNIFSGHAPL